jgi:hypothetical protein
MNPHHVNPYDEYLEAEVRKARFARDEAVAQMILGAAESIARYVAKVSRAAARATAPRPLARGQQK